jgi:hypothetical protein
MLYFLSSSGVKGERILLSCACYTELVSVAFREFVGVIKASELEFIGIATWCSPALSYSAGGHCKKHI